MIQYITVTTVVLSHVSPGGCNRTWEWCDDDKAQPGLGSGSPVQSRRDSGHSSYARSACAYHPSPETFNKIRKYFSFVLCIDISKTKLILVGVYFKILLIL